jgi:hypothetical protein
MAIFQRRADFMKSALICSGKSFILVVQATV